MEKYLRELRRILGELEAIGDELERESRVMSAELEERLRLGLHGEAAIKHHDLWMQQAGLTHLMVEKP